MARAPGTTSVTGATGGIGPAVSSRLAAAGHRLVLAARNAERLAAELPRPRARPGTSGSAST